MARNRVRSIAGLAVRDDQPLIGVVAPDQVGVTHYFPDEASADQALQSAATDVALRAIGSWSDLDWEETIQALEAIRHESEPTPPMVL